MKRVRIDGIGGFYIETAYKKPKFSWAEYFSNKKTGGHKYSSEEFLLKEANEKLFHLGGGKTLLDFGCGAGELLKYYMPSYEKAVGADFSSSMLLEAEKKMCQQNYKNVDLILADDKTVWNKLDLKFDRITAAQVVQYLTPQQLDTFIENASKYLSEGGKIVLFDIINPRVYPLWKYGWFSKNFRYWKTIPRFCIECYRRISAFLKGDPGDITGYTHSPFLIEEIANRHGFKMEYVNSMYYDYRYHAILSKKPVTI